MAEENEEALLEKTRYYESCSGCKVERMKQLQRGFPFRDLFFVWIIVLSTSLPISSLYPFLYYMIEDFGIAKMDKDIGFYAGFVGSSFMLGRTLTSVFWGIVADRYGRKPVILVGTISIVILKALFGLSLSFWMAIGTRFLLGTFNCLFGTMKAYATEIFRDEYQATAMSAVTTAWGIGLIIGPALGGFLAQPADKYPNIFSKESIFGRFPYSLPCFVISVFALLATTICFWIPETLHNHKLDIASHDDSYEALAAESCESSTNGDAEENEGSKLPSQGSLLKNWPLMSSVIVYCVLSLHDIAYSEIFSLWANSPRKYGGLSYSTNDVGTVLAISGMHNALMIPLQTSYPFIVKLSGLSLSLVLNCASILMNVLSVSALTGLMILQNRAVDQRQRGAANGIAMTGMSLSKTISPAGAGALFSWSEKQLYAAFLPEAICRAIVIRFWDRSLAAVALYEAVGAGLGSAPIALADFGAKRTATRISGMHMVFFILNMIVVVGVAMTFKPFLTTRRR